MACSASGCSGSVSALPFSPEAWAAAKAPRSVTSHYKSLLLFKKTELEVEGNVGAALCSVLLCSLFEM